MSDALQSLGVPTLKGAASVLGGVPTLPKTSADPLPGQLFLNPKLAPQVKGNARPFAPGEWLKNPDGGWSSEISVTVTDPSINGGKATILPSLWIVDGKPVRVEEDQAVEYAKQSGLTFNAFDSIEAAEAAANQRETTWQSMQPQDAGSVAPLWQVP